MRKYSKKTEMCMRGQRVGKPHIRRSLCGEFWFADLGDRLVFPAELTRLAVVEALRAQIK